MDDTKRVIEIEGVKVEVDLRTAKRVEELRIGSKVKVLTKHGYSEPAIYPGVVVGFEPFERLPTIVVAYLFKDYSTAELKFLHYNAKSKEDTEIVAAADDVIDLDRAEVEKHFDRAIRKHEIEIEALTEHRAYFQRHFKQYWEQVEPAHEPEVPPAPTDDVDF